MSNDIKTSEISIVVQGAIDSQETKKCLQSIREFLPEAEIILSTWKNSNLTGFEKLYDVLVLNEDPKAVYYEISKTYHNINRQIVSTKNGLSKASRKYILKLRSDLILTNSNFIEYFDKYPIRKDEYQLFKNKVIVPATFSRFKYRHSSIPTPFQISDWWYFGLAEDIKKFFDSIEVVEEPYYSKYFESQDKLSYLGKRYPARYTPEQYFCLSAFGKYFPDIKMNDLMDFNEDICKKSSIAIINNFIILEYKEHGIYTNKHIVSKDEKLLGEGYCTLYNKINYEKGYNKLFDTNFEYDIKTAENFNKTWYIKWLKLYKHLNELRNKNFKFNRKIESLFFSIPACCLSLAFFYLFNRKKVIDK